MCSPLNCTFKNQPETSEIFKSDTAVCSLTLDYAVWCTPQSLTPRMDAHHLVWLHGVFKNINFVFLTLLCNAHWGVLLHGMMPPVESNSTVWYTPRSLTLRYDANCRDWLPGMMHTAEFLKDLNISAKSKKEFENILFCLSGTQMSSNHEKIEVK